MNCPETITEPNGPIKPPSTADNRFFPYTTIDHRPQSMGHENYSKLMHDKCSSDLSSTDTYNTLQHTKQLTAAASEPSPNYSTLNNVQQSIETVNCINGYTTISRNKSSGVQNRNVHDY